MRGVKPEQIDRRRMNPQQHRYSAAELELRRAACPKPEYPEELPVSARRAEIARAIAEHQVVIVCGETGSGKTTQLPKICLELGRGIAGLIGHTQPRRIAARATAARIAQELKTELGGAVGYKIRFTDKRQPAHLHQADDRRHPARRDPGRPRCCASTTRSSSTRRTSAASTSISCSAI